MFIASNTVGQMILKAAEKRGGTPVSVLPWNTRLSELALIDTSVQSHRLGGPWGVLIGTRDLRESADMQDFLRMHGPNVLLGQS